MPQAARNRFPNELLQQIVLSLGDDRTSLSQCNLVARSICAMSQPQQWRRLALTDRSRIQRLYAYLMEAPRLQGYVVDLTLGPDALRLVPATQATRIIVVDIIARLSNVAYLRLEPKAAVYVAWSDIDTVVIAALVQHTLPRLRTLSFCRLSGIPLQDIITACPSLLRLSMEEFTTKHVSSTQTVFGLNLRELALKYYDETDFADTTSLNPILPAVQLRSIELKRYARRPLVLSVGVEPLISTQLTSLQHFYLELDFRRSHVVQLIQTLGSLGIRRFMSLKVLEIHLMKEPHEDPSPFFEWIAAELSEVRVPPGSELVIAVDLSGSIAGSPDVAQSHGHSMSDYYWEALDKRLSNTSLGRIVVVFRLVVWDEFAVTVLKRALPRSTSRGDDQQVIRIEKWDGNSLYF